jgi:hypothetical protein
MAYYKVVIEVWCGWDPEDNDMEEICRQVALGETLFVLSRKSSRSSIVRKTSTTRKR